MGVSLFLKFLYVLFTILFKHSLEGSFWPPAENALLEVGDAGGWVQ